MNKDEFLTAGKELVAKQEEQKAAAEKQETDLEAQRLLDEQANNKDAEEQEEVAPVAETEEQKAAKTAENKKALQEARSKRIEDERVKKAAKDFEEAKKNDEFLNGYLEAKSLGKHKDYIKAFSNIEDIDFDTLDEKSLFLETLRGTDQTDDEKEDAYSTFSSLPDKFKADALKSKKAELQENLNKNKEKLSVKNPYKEHAPKAYAEIEASVDEFVGTVWNDVDVSIAIADKVDSDARRLLAACANDDGTFNVKRAMEEAKKINMFDLVIAKQAEKANSEGKIETAKKFFSADAAPELNKDMKQRATDLEKGQQSLAARQKAQIPQFKN